MGSLHCLREYRLAQAFRGRTGRKGLKDRLQLATLSYSR
jgi:hypothetical protein